MKAYRLISPVVLGLLAASTLLTPTNATGPFNFAGEGCHGWGLTQPSGSNMNSETDADVDGGTTPCNYAYVSGNYQISGTWYYGLGPGWCAKAADCPNAHPLLVVVGANHANLVAHSGCNPGGPCANAGWTYTSH